MYKKVCAAGLFFFYLFPAFCIQIAPMNSDDFEYKSYGKEKLESLIQKSRSFLNTSPEQVRINATKALELASANHDTTYISLSYSYLGASYVMDKMYDTAFLLLGNAEYYALRIKDKVPLIRVYNNIATVHEQNGDLEKAFDFYFKSTQIILEYGLTNQYLPRLSLSKLYCMKQRRNKAMELLNQIIVDAKQNSDVYFELLASLNLLEVKLKNNLVQPIHASEEYLAITNKIVENNIVKLDNRLIELKVVLNIKKNNFEQAFSQVMLLSEKTLKDKRRKKQFIKRIQEASILLNDFDNAMYADSLINLIENSIYSDYEYQISIYNRAIYELSNQRMILEQINSDKNYIEKKLSRKNYFVNVLLGISLVLFIIVLILIPKKQKSTNEKEISYEPIDIFFDSLKKDNLLTKIGYPSFILNSDYIYQEANNAFYYLSKKAGVESLRGCNDYDLPWRENADKLFNIYNKVKDDSLEYWESEDLFNCKSEILFLPLIANGQFSGIAGIVMPNRKNGELKKTEIEMNVMLSKNNIKPKVLIVDDEEDNIILISRLLKAYNCEIRSTYSGIEALQIIRNNKLDFVLMDLEMPQMSGIEAVRSIPMEIREKIKVFALTAHAKNEIKSEDVELFDSIISKPVSKAKLVDKLSLSLKY